MTHARLTQPTAQAAAPASQKSSQAPLRSQSSVGTPILQRQASCACGGGCPRCQSEAILQPKLKIGGVGDRYEQEADRVADQLMAAPAHTVVSGAPPRIQRYTGNMTAGTDTARASVDHILSSSGRPLDPALQQDMGQRFGHDLSQVRVHTGVAAERSAQNLSAHAFTVGQRIVFGAGQFKPKTQAGRWLLAHELTHTVQQKTSLLPHTIQRQRAGFGDVHLAEARDAEEARQKALFFDRLRSLSPSTDTGLRAEVEARFPSGTDDRWLAETILRNGPEPRWSLADLSERQRRAMTNAWAPEPGNIRAVLGGSSHTVEAFYFRGTSDRRALIIGGVHGSEPGGVEVVNDLLTLMRGTNAPMPFFSVIIVPELFAANVHSSRPLAERRTSGGTVRSSSPNAWRGVEETPDPNRQFPAVGSDPVSDPTLGCIVDDQHRCIEPENLVLLDLINRFQPERVASVHGHSVPHATSARTAEENLRLEGGPSITTDPRPSHESDDEDLALSMATAAQRLGVRIPANFMGQPQQTTRYPTGTAPRRSEGVTFGQWGSHATPTRPAMNIILIETFGNTTTASASEAQRAARRTELMNLAQILRDFFLGSPTP